MLAELETKSLNSSFYVDPFVLYCSTSTRKTVINFKKKNHYVYIYGGGGGDYALFPCACNFIALFCVMM